MPCVTTSGSLALCDLQPGIVTFSDFVMVSQSLSSHIPIPVYIYIVIVTD